MIIDSIIDLALDAGIDRLSEKIDERKLREDLERYIKNNKKYMMLNSREEEFDFQGLVEYIHNHLLDDVKNRIFAVDKTTRSNARKQIIEKACSYASSQPKESKDAITKYVSNCIDMIREFYKKKSNFKDSIIMSEAVYAIENTIKDENKELKDVIVDSKNEILAAQSKGSPFSVDNVLNLIQNQGIGSLEEKFRIMMKHISVTHPLYPNYGYDYNNGVIKSVPLNNEARRLYPEQLNFRGPIKIDGKYIDDPNFDPFDYAYRHQLTITMKVLFAQRFLGKVPDPAQGDLKNIVELQAIPPEFPPATACSIKVGENVFYNYILLKTREILDDGTIIISNEEQNAHANFLFSINPNVPSKCELKFYLHGGDNKDLLNYCRFMKALRDLKDVRVCMLENGEEIISGKFNGPTGKNIENIEEEIDLLERICLIEQHFNVTLKPENAVTNAEFNTISVISDLIRNDDVSRSWDGLMITGVVDEQFRKIVLGMNDIPLALSYTGVDRVSLFGAEFELRYMRTYKCVKFVNIEKLKQKVQVLEDGDEIKLKLEPGDDNTYIETIHIPEEFRM